MTEEQAALATFFGTIYGQTKEIEGHVMAAGGDSKLAPNTDGLKNLFKQTLAGAPTPVVHAPDQPVQVPDQGLLPLVASNPISRPQQADTLQLELPLKSDGNTVLNSIFNVLFDIKKILLSMSELQKQQQKQEPTEPPAKQGEVLNECCICGAKAKLKYWPESEAYQKFTIQCPSCKNMSAAPSRLKVVRLWNSQVS